MREASIQRARGRCRRSDCLERFRKANTGFGEINECTLCEQGARRRLEETGRRVRTASISALLASISPVIGRKQRADSKKHGAAGGTKRQERSRTKQEEGDDDT